MTKDGLPTGKSAIQQVGNLRYRIGHRICAPEHLANFIRSMDEAEVRRVENIRLVQIEIEVE